MTDEEETRREYDVPKRPKPTDDEKRLQEIEREMKAIRGLIPSEVNALMKHIPWLISRLRALTVENSSLRAELKEGK